MDRPYDFIIAGAGSAGCALANRLSRDPTVRVLLLEAGGWDKDPMIGVPVGIRPMTIKKLYRWNDVSEPDPELGGRVNEIPHGKVIGGGSSINYMAHTRGHPVDYERWFEAGATGWRFDDLLPVFKECETWEGEQSEWRGRAGELGVQRGRMDDPIEAAWFEAVRSRGHLLTDDHNGAEPEGFGMVQYTIRKGRRASSARAFLHPALDRPNLTVVTGAHVAKVLFEGSQAVGVEYLVRGCSERVHAGRIVVSMGAINTPQLLMLSGIGPAEHLRTVGIAPRVDLPVGKGLEDHLGVLMLWKRKRPGNFHRSLRMDRAALAMVRSLLFASGPSSRLPGVLLGYMRSRPAVRQPDLQLYLGLPPLDADVWFPGLKAPYQDALCVRINLLSQQSRGEVLLRSRDPLERPRVFYHSLTKPQDLETLREGVRQAQAIVESPSLASYRGEMLMPGRPPQHDADIDAFIRSTAFQQYHPACTCKMGSGPDAVLDAQLNVRGVQGLSVVDASAMPNLISANPNVPTIAMALKAAAMWTSAT